MNLLLAGACYMDPSGKECQANAAMQVCRDVQGLFAAQEGRDAVRTSKICPCWQELVCQGFLLQARDCFAAWPLGQEM